MSEKRPETTADIVSRSAALSLDQVAGDLRERARRSKPRKQRGEYTVDLPSHLAECDANYHRLLRLFATLRERDEHRIALPMAGDSAHVVFTVNERGPYTTLLHIAVVGADRWLDVTSPELTVRAYHDAKSAEVVAYQDQNRFHGVYEYPNTRMRQRDEKVQLNRFLGEFLTLLMSHGASVEPIDL